MSPIIQQRNAETIRMLKKMETDKLNKRVELALASFTMVPKVPDVKTRANAVVARAIMTDSAPARFFSEDAAVPRKDTEK